MPQTKEEANQAFEAFRPFFVQFKMANPGAWEDLSISVMDGEIRVGYAEFTFDDDQTGIACQNVEVNPQYRRRGIASAMYVLAERLTGRALNDSWRNDPIQTADAKAFWANPKRLFGNRPQPQ